MRIAHHGRRSITAFRSCYIRSRIATWILKRTGVNVTACALHDTTNLYVLSMQRCKVLPWSSIVFDTSTSGNVSHFDGASAAAAALQVMAGRESCGVCLHRLVDDEGDALTAAWGRAEALTVTCGER